MGYVDADAHVIETDQEARNGAEGGGGGGDEQRGNCDDEKQRHARNGLPRGAHGIALVPARVIDGARLA